MMVQARSQENQRLDFQAMMVLEEKPEEVELRKLEEEMSPCGPYGRMDMNWVAED